MRASLLGTRWSSACLRLGTRRVFTLCFAVPAALIAVYATVLSGRTVLWQAATACWLLTLLVMWLISRLAAMIERCEREAGQGEGALSTAVGRGREPGGSEGGLRGRVAHLEQVIVRQHRFVSDAAHELRTPLTAQSLIAENILARQGVPAAELRESISSMLEESRHMKRLIDGLLDLTRASLTDVAAGQGMPRQAVALDLSTLTRDCVELLRALAEEKQQTIEVSVAAELWADADLTMVRQALLNIIHNSIEHCPAGARIQVETTRLSPQQAVVRVQDDGPGIPLHQQHRVFERFFRGGGGSRNRGLGLGLSIAKAILCSQGGKIELASRPGAGCCFLLTLPLTPAARPHPVDLVDEVHEPRVANRERRDQNHWSAPPLPWRPAVARIASRIPESLSFPTPGAHQRDQGPGSDTLPASVPARTVVSLAAVGERRTLAGTGRDDAEYRPSGAA